MEDEKSSVLIMALFGIIYLTGAIITIAFIIRRAIRFIASEMESYKFAYPELFKDVNTIEDFLKKNPSIFRNAFTIAEIDDMPAKLAIIFWPFVWVIFSCIIIVNAASKVITSITKLFLRKTFASFQKEIKFKNILK